MGNGLNKGDALGIWEGCVWGGEGAGKWDCGGEGGWVVGGWGRGHWGCDFWVCLQQWVWTKRCTWMSVPCLARVLDGGVVLVCMCVSR